MTRGMGIGGMETTFAREGHAFRAGIREGERRMLWAIAVGACWQSHFSLLGYTPGRRDQAYAVATYAMRALEDLGDEDASRVLGERGW